MKTKIWLGLFLLFSHTAVRGEAQYMYMNNLPDAVVDRAAHLVATGEYPGIVKMSEEVDVQFKGVHSPDYFRNLLAILTGVLRDKSELSYDRRWAIRKLQWKILLAKHSSSRNALQILQMKEFMTWADINPGGASLYADDAQVVALRQDAAAMFLSYRDCLESWTIPNYKYKPVGPGMMSVVVSPEVGAKMDAEIQRMRPTWEQNKMENNEQYELQGAQMKLKRDVMTFILRDFAAPPNDDATVEKLLESFPDDMEPREWVLKQLRLAQEGAMASSSERKVRAVAALKEAK